MKEYPGGKTANSRVGAILVGTLAIVALVAALWMDEARSVIRYLAGRKASVSREVKEADAVLKPGNMQKIAIRIGDDGQVYLNEAPIDSLASGALPKLTASLVQLKKAGDASRSEVDVTIYSPDTAHRRMPDVMASLGQAKISTVTLQLAE